MKLTQVATAQSPTTGTTGPNGRLWIGEWVGNTGTVRFLTDEGMSEPVLTVETSAQSDGLAGITFDPDFSHFYISYTNADDHNVIEEFDVVDGEVQVDSGRTILFLEQRAAAHHSGHIAFGPDGMLYVSFGDGEHGEPGDPFDNGQNLGTLQSTVLRIDVDGGDPYAIPADNPFVDVPGARGEVWHYGLRNPWKFSFDARTGHMWIGDVGNHAVEEIDFARRGDGGKNFGWPNMEGTRVNRGPEPDNHTPPVYEYDAETNDGPCFSVTGGFVYRGKAIPKLRGHYVFADYCSGKINALKVKGNGEVKRVVDLGINGGWVTSFVQTPDNELYVLDMGPFGDPGEDAIYRIDPA